MGKIKRKIQIYAETIFILMNTEFTLIKSSHFFAYKKFPLYYQSISDHQRSWGYEDGPWKGPGPPLLVVADF
jgi:hypothetical protein